MADNIAFRKIELRGAAVTIGEEDERAIEDAFAEVETMLKQRLEPLGLSVRVKNPTQTVIRQPESINFTVEWMDHEGVIVAMDEVRKKDLSAAIRWAAAQMARGFGNAADAHGFFVIATAEREGD